MNYYFMDYENVHAEGFTGIEQVEANDIIYVVYSEQSKAFSLDIVEKVDRQKAIMKAYKAGVGSKNALDFQLSSFLGYIIGKTENEECNYYIVSKDTGYDKVVSFWADKGLHIARIVNLSGENTAEDPKKKEADVAEEIIENAENQPKTNTKSTPKAKEASKSTDNTKGIIPATREEVLKVLSKEEYSDRILEIINSYKTKQAINTALSKEFKDSKKSGAIYQKLKPLFKQKNKT